MNKNITVMMGSKIIFQGLCVVFIIQQGRCLAVKAQQIRQHSVKAWVKKVAALAE